MYRDNTIDTDRFILRPLQESDVTQEYLKWFRDDSIKKFINAAPNTRDLEALKNYINERAGRDDIIFFGIFDKLNGLHIGNIKFEPVNFELGFAIMGILIGNEGYRGKGVASEILQSTARWLKQHHEIREILLGVSRENISAIKAYQRVGFVVMSHPELRDLGDSVIPMVWQI
jgi:RimJ/RimL family protein N-acetyltransferase